MCPELRSWLSASDRETPVFTGVNGTLMARRRRPWAGDLFRVRSPRQSASRASSQFAIPAVLPGSGRGTPLATAPSGTRRARASSSRTSGAAGCLALAPATRCVGGCAGWRLSGGVLYMVAVLRLPHRRRRLVRIAGSFLRSPCMTLCCDIYLCSILDWITLLIRKSHRGGT
jgi:hypothetical protein